MGIGGSIVRLRKSSLSVPCPISLLLSRGRWRGDAYRVGGSASGRVGCCVMASHLRSGQILVRRFEGRPLSTMAEVVVDLSKADLELYELFALIDGIRFGRARERKLAAEELSRRIWSGVKDS